MSRRSLSILLLIGGIALVAIASRRVDLGVSSGTPLTRAGSTWPANETVGALPPVSESVTRTDSAKRTADGDPITQDPGPELEVEEAPALGEPTVQATIAASLQDSAKARILLSMLPGLPEESLQNAAEQALSRLRDEDYRAAAFPLLANPQTHGQVLSALFADLMERPDFIALPCLLAVARNPTHPYAEVARNDLDLLIGQDLGTNWPAWETAIRRRLAAHP